MPPQALGPEEEKRSVAADLFFERIDRHARSCGVTRLAEITRLDRLGLPVWQAVRPAGRALSVHQGKAADSLGAKIGALCEAIESHCAENAAADGPLCSFAALAPSERAPAFSDYSRSRELTPADREPVQWCRADDIVSGGTRHLPHDLVSLDLTRRGASWADRSSGGLGAGAAADEAMTTSLLEILERDAVGEWKRLAPPDRLAAAVDLETVRYAWFEAWRARLAELGVDLAVFAPETLTGIPIAVCWIGAVEEFGTRYRRFSGSACHGDPEQALFKALAEAIQSRLTLIAGVRDDILPSSYARFGTPPLLADGAAGRRDWGEMRPCPSGWEDAAARLVARGYRQIAVKRLDGGLDEVAVTKMFVPGLGSLTRTRRRAG